MERRPKRSRKALAVINRAPCLMDHPLPRNRRVNIPPCTVHHVILGRRLSEEIFEFVINFLLICLPGDLHIWFPGLSDAMAVDRRLSSDTELLETGKQAGH